MFNPVGKTYKTFTEYFQFVNYQFSCYINTDKPVYKPEDTLKYNIYCIDGETRPYNPKTGTVKISDSKGNQIAKYENVTFTKGKHKGSMILSTNAIKGIWTVSFRGHNEVNTLYSS